MASVSVAPPSKEAISISQAGFHTACASLPPSGDHCGGPWVDRVLGGASRTFRGVPPRAGITNSPPPSRLDQKAIWLPSGDQLGQNASPTMSFVRLTETPPGSWLTQMSHSPASSDWYATCVPSGRQLG